MADDTQTTANAQNTQSSGGQQDAAQTQGQTQEKTFTQTELNRILKERLDGERARFADYDQLKTKVAELDAANKTEIEKAIEKATKAETRLKEVETQAKRREIMATAKELALEVGFDHKKLDKIVRLVDVTDDSTAETIKASLESLAKEMPELLKGKAPPPDTGASNPARQGDAPQETREQRLARIRGGGQGFQDWLNGASVTFTPEVNPKQQ